MVPSPSARTGCEATLGAVPENSRPLRLLRYDRQWALVEEIQSGGQANLAKMAPPPIADTLGYALGSVRLLNGTLPVPADSSGPFCVRSETVT